MAEQKVSKAELYRYIAAAITRNPASQLPPFPRRYFVDETSPGIKLYLRETDERNVVEYVHEHCLANEIMQWLAKEVVPVTRGYEMEFKHAIDAARYWRAIKTPIGKIKSVAWPEEEGFTFRRLPWLQGTAQTPLFNEMFNRTSNARALKCFIGSLFFEQSDMQAYCWIHGQGSNGKGALSRFLHRVFGNAYSSQTPPNNGDKFWTSMIIGKRLVVYPDCNNQSYVTSGLFKSLTGGDPIRIEQKNQPAGTAVMTAKHMILSNERPSLSSEKADQRRIIYCEMGEVKSAIDPKYEEKLWVEGGSFIAICMGTYLNDCPQHGSIPVSNSEILSDWVSTVEEEFETAWEHNFVIIGGKETFVAPSAFQDRLNEIWKTDRKTQLAFRSWCERTHGLKKATHHGLPGTPKVYFGVAMTFAGQQIRTGQCVQKEQQEKWIKEGRYRDVSGTAKGRLRIVEPQ